jgi:hypothetical protein
MKTSLFNIRILVICTTLLLVGCGGRSSKGVGPKIERSPEWGVVDSNEKPVIEDNSNESFATIPDVPYEPKVSFTGRDTLDSLCSLVSEYEELGKANTLFLDGCYYSGDTSTPFLASFAERWNKAAFLRRFVNAEELFERENTNIGDSLTTDTVRGKMPMLKNEYQLAFRNSTCVAKAKKLVKMLTTIDYVPAECEKMANLFSELVNVPYDTPDYVTEADIEAIQKDFWTLYEKSQYVQDIAEIQKIRVNEDYGTEALENLRSSLQKRYVESMDFDERCILACEMTSCGQENGIDYLGELIEAGQYSKYLLEVWVDWRLYAQQGVFGISTYSEIPDNLYDNARLLVAKQFAEHITKTPDDMLAKVLLLNLTYTETLHRGGGYYGNEALGASLFVKERYFLPDELSKDSE